jgi:hypothetical protein
LGAAARILLDGKPERPGVVLAIGSVTESVSLIAVRCVILT